MTQSIRTRARQLLASVAIGAVVVTLIPMLGAWPQTTAQAQYVVAAEFRTALSPYGRWQRHSRWGEVWIADPVPSGWRPYTRGRWVYTDEWGYYWNADAEEADWGWVTYHYGRWVHDGELGWLWVPGNEWAPAWVDWRRGDDHVGWAPLPPDEILVTYRDDPIYWTFVRPRYLLAPRLLVYIAAPRERLVIIRRTVIVNRTVIVDRDRNGDRRGDRDRDGDRERGRARDRVAVNAGIDPGIIAKATGKPIRAAKVEPAVLRGTKVEGTREVDPADGKRARASVKETNVLIKPSDKVEPPKELGANEKGRLGDRPLKAAQDNQGAGNQGLGNRGNQGPGNQGVGNRGNQGPGNQGVGNNANGNRPGDTGRSSPPPIANDRGRSGVSSPPPPPPAANERRRNEGANTLQSPPPPPPVARRDLPPPPPPVVRRQSPPAPSQRVSPAPPPASFRERLRENRVNGQNNRQNNRGPQEDDRARGR